MKRIIKNSLEDYERLMLQNFAQRVGEDAARLAMKCWLEELPQLFIDAHRQKKLASSVDSHALFEDIVKRYSA